MLKRIMSVLALASVAGAPAMAQAAPAVSAASVAAFQDGSEADDSTVTYVVAGVILVIFIFVAKGIFDEDEVSVSP
jgi:hypothetical protein